MNNLQKAVKEIIEENGGKSFAQDVVTHGCVSGIVTELIYYSDTHKWFDTHYSDIMELVEEYEEMLGEKLQWQGDMKNWFAWFSFEETARQLYNL
jgi:helix-turn-helix protein